MTDDLTRIADALERNTAALQAILQRLAEPTLLPLLESKHDAEPEPEPDDWKPTAAELLWRAVEWAKHESAVEAILVAAMRYAETNHEWFAEWHAYELPSRALMAAATEAQNAGDNTAPQLLNAASHVAADHPHLFGGAK